MSKHSIFKLPKQHFSQLKPHNIKLISPISPNDLSNKENLRDLIMDYIIQNLFKQTHKQKLLKKKTYQNGLKSVPFMLEVEVNGIRRQVQVNGLVILEKYIQFEKKNLYRQNNIEPLVVDILNFFDEMQEIADNTNFQITEDNISVSFIVNILLEKYHKDQQRLTRMKEVELMKHKTVAKYTRVSYLDIENNLQKKQCQVFVQKNIQNSHRVSRDTFSSQVSDKLSSQTHYLKPSKSKLRDLVDKYKIFQHPQKVQHLRKQILKQVYSPKIVDDMFQKQQNQAKQKQTSSIIQDESQKKSSIFGEDCINFLQNWISDISISQKLYKTKFQSKNNNKRKQLNRGGGKIIEQSHDQESNSENQIHE